MRNDYKNICFDEEENSKALHIACRAQTYLSVRQFFN